MSKDVELEPVFKESIQLVGVYERGMRFVAVSTMFVGQTICGILTRTIN